MVVVDVGLNYIWEAKKRTAGLQLSSTVGLGGARVGYHTPRQYISCPPAGLAWCMGAGRRILRHARAPGRPSQRARACTCHPHVGKPFQSNPLNGSRRIGRRDQPHFNGLCGCESTDQTFGWFDPLLHLRDQTFQSAGGRGGGSKDRPHQPLQSHRPQGGPCGGFTSPQIDKNAFKPRLRCWGC